MQLTKTARFKRIICAIAFGLLVALSAAPVAQADCPHGQDSCKGKWGISGATFNAGFQHACDEKGICADQTAGELGVGKTCDPAASNEYCAQAGFNTSTPYLEFVVNQQSVDVGVLQNYETHVGSATFTVKSYLAHGYQVTSMSPAPTSGDHTLATPNSPSAPTVGQEQFGINVVKNDCPASTPAFGEDGGCDDAAGFGALPTQLPDSSFSFGSWAANYGQANKYMYNPGDTIAQSDRSSGTTKYTISYIFNISPTTPAGVYTMDQTLVATSTF